MEVCLSCNSQKNKKVVSKGVDYEYWVPFDADVVQCLDCGLVFQQPRPSADKLPSYYPADYANYSDPTSIVTRTLVQIKEYLDARQVIGLIGKTGAILDVGCADGHYLDYMKRFGEWDLQGTDISPEAASKAALKGYKVYTGELEALELPPDTFSIVRMNHLLEHVVNPFTTLSKAFSILRPGGYLIGETPNISCPDFHIFKRYWGALHLPRHIHFFSPRTLKSALSVAGFTANKINHTLMTSGWALGVQNYLQSKKKRQLVNGRIKGYPILLIAFIPVLAVQKAAKASTMMHFFAQKPVSNIK